jgi:large repetitive protein
MKNVLYPEKMTASRHFRVDSNYLKFHNSHSKLITRLLVLIFVLLLSVTFAKAQDTVCVNSLAVPYSVTNHAGASYTWALSGGGALTSTSGNATSVNWGATPGTYTLQVQETSSAGCLGDPVTLNVVVLPLATATIAGNSTLCYSDGTPTVTVTLTGVGPWTFTYTDGTTPVTVTNHNSTTYTIPLSMAALTPAAGGSPKVTTYTLTAINNKFCSGTFSGSAVITVNPKPVTSAISH